MNIFLIALTFLGVTETQTPAIWGGDHVEIEVTAAGARIDFDCAHGTIDEPLRPDAKGAFKVKGTFAAEHAGPSRDDDAPAPKAVYSGTIKDDAMTLRVVVDGREAGAKTYDLVRNRRGNVRKCR